MKHLQPLLCMVAVLCNTALGDQLPKTHEERVQEMTKQGYNLIDALFEQAQVSIVAKQDLMTKEWLSKQGQIRELQNLLSDASIECGFDVQKTNPIPGVLSAYVQDKIIESVPTVCSIDGIAVKRIEDFYEFSHMLCKVSGGARCATIMRTIQNDNFELILQLKLHKMVRQQLRKENARQLRNAIIMGMR